MPGALHILLHLINMVTIWGLNYYVSFIGEEIEVKSVQEEFIATLLQSFFIFSQEHNAKLGRRCKTTALLSTLYETSILVKEVGHKIGECNFSLMLNHTNRDELTFCENKKLLPKNMGPKEVFPKVLILVLDLE